MLNFDFYSPEEELSLPLYSEHGVRVFVKRDDLIHPYISGNKWRKLKYPLTDARASNKKLLVTFGGAWSNHLLATACAAAKFGFASYAFVRGEKVSNPVLDLCKLFGMNLHFVDRSSYRDKAGLYNQHFSDNPTAYFLAEGGYSSLAAQGCAEIWKESKRHYEHCFCACGTGTTLAGLLQGAQEQSLTTQLHGIPVLKGGSFILDEIQQLGITPTEQVSLHLDYHFGGYAKTKPELLTFVKNFTAETGMLLEPTYTGKLFYGLHDQIAQDKIAAGSTILVIHSGGLTGLLGTLAKF